MAVVILDAGHGGNDLGVVYERRFEKNDNLKLAEAVGEILRQKGVNVLNTRNSDKYISLIDRRNIANEEGGDLFITIHRGNSPIPNTISGVRASIYEEDETAREAAENILDNLEKLGFNNLGIQIRNDLISLRETNMPSVMLEVGFIDSEHDNEIFDERFNSVAQAIASGILESLGMSGTVKASVIQCGCYKEQKENMEGYRYRVQLGLFKDYNHALDFQKQLLACGCPAEIEKQGEYFAVTAGDYELLDEAVCLEMSLRRMGYRTLITTI